MKIAVKELAPCKRLLEIEVPIEAVKKGFDEFYAELSKTAKVPGFRPGKTPRNILEGRYQKEAKGEVLRKIIPASYREAMRKHSLTPVEVPEVSEVKFEKEGALSFKATVDIRPEIRLGDYTGLKVTRKRVEVAPAEVAKVLEELKEANAHYAVVEARPVKKGDYIIVDLEGFVGTSSIDKRKDLWLVIEEGSYLPGLTEALIDLEQGQEREVKLTLPEDFKRRELAKREAIFKVRVKEIKEKVLPPLDDELAASLGEFKGLDELKEAVRKDLVARKQAEGRLDLENQILDQLIKRFPFEAPDSLVTRQTERLLREAKVRGLYQGLKKEDIDSQEPALRKKLSPNALRQVKVAFILEEIAGREKIKVSDEEIDQKISDIAKSSKQAPDEVRKYLKDKEMLDNLRSELRTQKTLNFLVEKANIKEK